MKFDPLKTAFNDKITKKCIFLNKNIFHSYDIINNYYGISTQESSYVNLFKN